MLRTILTAAALLCVSQTAFAQQLTAEQRDACMGDYQKYCKSVTPGGGRIIACLAKQSDKLTPECKRVLTAAEKNSAALNGRRRYQRTLDRDRRASARTASAEPWLRPEIKQDKSGRLTCVPFC